MENEYLELTNPQKSIWLTNQMYPNTPIENICGSVTIEEKVNFIALQKSINLFVKNNDSFRIKLVQTKDGVKQYISHFSSFNVEIIKVNFNSDVNLIEKNLVATPFPLTDTILFKFIMFEFPDGHGGFVINAHHLISDAWTAGLVVNEIMDSYTKLIYQEQLLKEDFPSYKDYINSETEYLQSERFKKDENFWMDLYKDIPEIAKIPASKEISSSENPCASMRQEFKIDKKIIDSINLFCVNHKVSIFNFFMAIYAIYISKISGLQEFVIGTPILNRSGYKEKHTTGMFISTIPFKISLGYDFDFSYFVSSIGKDAISLFRHQKYPYQYLLENLRKKFHSLPNLYDILISYQNVRSEKQSSIVPFHANWIPNNCLSDGMNIHLYDMNDTGSLTVAYDYLTSCYNSCDICFLHKRIINIVNQVLENPNILLTDIDIITPSEKQKVLYDFNNTNIDYDKYKTISMLFEEQVEKSPNAIAIVFENKKLTYLQLNKKANSLANYLRNIGISNNSIVGIMLNRSFEMIISILAVLKAGGAYIPIDPEYPSERISYMLENSKSNFLISSSNLEEKYSHISSVNPILVDLSSNIYDYDSNNLVNISSPDDLSYLIYTSGSTGTPKGVMLTHKNLSNFCAAMYNKIEYLKEPNTNSIVSITTVSFDIFIFETIVSLTRGLTLFMTNYYEQKITSKLERLIIDNHINILQTTPSTMRFHIDNLSFSNSLYNLKYIMLAGEQLPISLIRQIKKLAPNCTIYNGYGPSETTIFSTVQDVTSADEVTIGKPIGNTQIYILDKNKRVLPPYTTGEIYIAGDGVGKGYHNNKNMTNQNFLENPFSQSSKLYKTGDLGAWLPNGCIKCFGRVDNQIKLRGLRIEIGEIEEIINSFDSEANLKSAIIVKQENDSKALHAFICASKPIDSMELKKYVQSYLPNYMVPNTFTQIENIPYTPNGKIDRKSLASLPIALDKVSSENIIPPRNKLDTVLLETIKKKLNIYEFGIDQNFFDYGADSLIIINILTELFQYDFGIKVNAFYEFPTVRQLSDHIASKKTVSTSLDINNLEKINNIVKSFNISVAPHPVSMKKNILITGCTGFLGAHLLAELLNFPDNVSSIFCLVRRKNGEDPENRLSEIMNFYFGDKYDSLLKKFVTVIESDISSENLGINPVALKLLKEEVDIVVHCAANVKHYGNYSDFEKANIIGTKNIVNFCMETKTDLHYISTMTISGNYLVEQQNTLGIFDEYSFFHHQSFDDNVYSKSKLLAEGYVISNIPHGLNATIYRIGDLSGRFSDGVFQKNIEENSIYLRLKSILEIGAVSENIKKLNLEFTPVDCASSAIRKIIWSDECKNRIFHIYNPNQITTETLAFYLKDFCEIKFMSKFEFNNYIKKLSANISSQKKLSGIINDFTNSNDLIYTHTISVNNAITCNYLNSLNFHWPVLTKDYFKLLLEYMKKVHFID